MPLWWAAIAAHTILLSNSRASQSPPNHAEVANHYISVAYRPGKMQFGEEQHRKAVDSILY